MITLNNNDRHTRSRNVRYLFKIIKEILLEQRKLNLSQSHFDSVTVIALFLYITSTIKKL